MSSAHFGFILLVCLYAWGGYRRLRRNVGRQSLRPGRAIRSIIILSLVSVLIVSTSLQNTNLLLGFGGGMLLGALLGFAGLKLTRFETTDEGHFYTPNTHIGVTLSLLLVGRIAYRLWANRDILAGQNFAMPFQSPLTLFIFGLTVGYYLVYQTGILIHSHDKNKSGNSPRA